MSNVPVELSEEELDGIAGGISIFVSGSTFEKNDIFSEHQRGSHRRGVGGSSIFKSSYISSSAFQIIGLGLNSASDVISFFKGLSGFFGRR